MKRKKWKRVAAKDAAKLVKDGMIVGLGTGSTLAEVIKILGRRKGDVKFVASSVSTKKLAEGLGLILVSLNENPNLDLTIDGADEVDPNFAMIKGGGGAHTREKIMASAAQKVVIVIDRSKLVRKIGEKSPVPVEVVPFAHEYTSRQLSELGGSTQLRRSKGEKPYVTDNGNYIVDVWFESIDDAAELEVDLNKIPGVVENGIFVETADRIFVGHDGGCAVLSSKEDFLEFLRG